MNKYASFVLKIILLIIAIILIVNGVKFIGDGFDVKENYYKSSSEISLSNKHVYVGGDAYNYIINANYFTGYIVLGSSLCICGAISIATSLLLKNSRKDKIE